MSDIDASIDLQFDDAPQQRLASQLGIWTFLATEVLFFGGLFAAYTVYRLAHECAFAIASEHLFMWIGAGNTAVLLLSSYTMALAVRAHLLGRRRVTVRLLLCTIALGLVFLAVKAVEYGLDYREGLVPGASFDASRWAEPHIAQMFFVLYFFMTALHAVHVIAGITVLMITAWIVKNNLAPARRNLVESVGLYWHFVDIVWLFLFPLLYLVSVP